MGKDGLLLAQKITIYALLVCLLWSLSFSLRLYEVVVAWKNVAYQVQLLQIGALHRTQAHEFKNRRMRR